MEKIYTRLVPKIERTQNEWIELTESSFFCHNGTLDEGLKKFNIHLITRIVHLEDANAGEVLTVKLAELLPTASTFVALEAKIVKVNFDGDWNWTVLDIYYDKSSKGVLKVEFEVAKIGY